MLAIAFHHLDTRKTSYPCKQLQHITCGDQHTNESQEQLPTAKASMKSNHLRPRASGRHRHRSHHHRCCFQARSWGRGLEISLEEERRESGHSADAKERRKYWTVIIKAILLVWSQSRAYRLFYNQFLFVFIMVSYEPSLHFLHL